jgi:hypothetical protein
MINNVVSTLFCSICGKILVSEYYVDFWGNKFCPGHLQEFEACFSCNRLVSPRLTGGGQKYSDHITVCNLCRQTEVTNDKRVYELFQQVKARMALLGLDLRRIPLFIRLVPITKVSPGTYSKKWEGQTQKSIYSRDGKITAQRVDEIKIIKGLPAEMVQSILTHEAAHAWIGIKGFPALPPFVEEGVCELIDFLSLSSQNTREAHYRIHLKFNNTDPIYGTGFKVAYAALSGRTLAQLLMYVKVNQTFP